MTTDDLLTLRNVLGLRRRALLADTHAAIAAVGAELVEMEGGA